MPKRTLLALGDCNTLGVGATEHDTFVERFARHVGLEPVNLGYTMSTTHEALRLFDERFGDDVAVLLIQYGLVDSWLTFKYSPYVLYYPDNLLRKYLRKVVKRLKKTARGWGLNRSVGERPVVPIPRYRRALESIIERAHGARVMLIETAPHQEADRNPRIREYNAVLAELAERYPHCTLVRCHDALAAGGDRYFVDPAHLNGEAFDLITQRLIEAYHAGDAGAPAAPSAPEPLPGIAGAGGRC